jgi:hypothetical protein
MAVGSKDWDIHQTNLLEFPSQERDPGHPTQENLGDPANGNED